MKGVSAVIAVILILMIVVALAALAYTWFTGIFAEMTGSIGSTISDTTSDMQLQFAIDAANCNDSGNILSFTLRNTGSGNISTAGVAAYLDNQPVTGLTVGGSATDILENGVVTFTNTSSPCTSGSVLKVTIENGNSNTKVL